MTARTTYLTRTRIRSYFFFSPLFVCMRARVQAVAGLIKRLCVWKKIKQTGSFSF